MKQTQKRRIERLKGANSPVASKLPKAVRRLFWDYDARSLTWEADRDLIQARVLSSGTWDAVTWIRKRIGDAEIRNWILRNHGRGLDERRLRFWQLVLGLPRKTVDAWIARNAHQLWRNRVKR